jgi:predicted DsbA family dithiol-disulfide isomerase
MATSDLDLMVIVDVICPWCYVGKRRMEKALTLLDTDAAVRLSWLPFELNPGMPKEGIERREYRIRKFGSWERSLQLDAQLKEVGVQEGLSIRYDLQSRTPNTFNAHRLIRQAAMGGSQTAFVEALFKAYFTEGRDIGNAETLADIAAENGMDRAQALAFLNSDELGDQVRQYEDAAHNAGITGVPAFVANRRPVLMGAHPPETIAAALRDAMGLAPATA